MSAGALLIRPRAAVVFFGLFFSRRDDEQRKKSAQKKPMRFGSACPEKTYYYYVFNKYKENRNTSVYIRNAVTAKGRPARHRRQVHSAVSSPRVYFFFSRPYAPEFRGLTFFSLFLNRSRPVTRVTFYSSRYVSIEIRFQYTTDTVHIVYVFHF